MEENIYKRIVDFANGKASESEKNTLFDLVETNDEVAEAFHDVLDLYTDSKEEVKWNADKAFDRWSSNVAVDKPKARTVQFFNPKNLLKIAAILLPLVIALSYFLNLNEIGPVEPTLVNIVTVQGENKSVELPDGTKIDLNENSRLSYQSGFKTRDVVFSGEGFFDVAKDAERTFTVTNQNAKVSVLGTQFNILSSDTKGTIEVAVVEGKVKMELADNPDKFVYLERNDLGYTDDQEIVKEITSADNVVGWKTKVLKYEDVLLNTVIADLEKVYKVDFDYNNKIGQCTYRVNFENYTLEQVIATLEFALNGTIKKSGSKWLIDATPCK